MTRQRPLVPFPSVEPLLGKIIGDENLLGFRWIIIGKLTGSKRIPLQNEWVDIILLDAETFSIPVFVKNNVGWTQKIQEFPKP